MKTHAIEIKFTSLNGKIDSTTLCRHADDGVQFVPSSSRELHLDKFGDVAYWLNRAQQAEDEVQKACRHRDRAKHEAQRLAFYNEADIWAHHYRFCLSQLAKASEALTAVCLAECKTLDECESYDK